MTTLGTNRIGQVVEGRGSTRFRLDTAPVPQSFGVTVHAVATVFGVTKDFSVTVFRSATWEDWEGGDALVEGQLPLDREGCHVKLTIHPLGQWSGNGEFVIKIAKELYPGYPPFPADDVFEWRACSWSTEATPTLFPTGTWGFGEDGITITI